MPERHVGRIRDAIAEMLRLRSADEFQATELVSAMRGLVGADTATIVDTGVSWHHGVRLGYSPSDLGVRLDRLPYDVHTLMARHPAHHHFPATRSMEPVRVSDVVGLARWRQSESLSLLRGYIGVRYQLMIPIEISAFRYIVVNLFRAARDFADKDRYATVQVQPVLIGLRALAARAAGTPKRNGADVPLTRRELEVLQVLTEGLTARALARRLGISPHTASRHIESVYAKLGTHDRASTVMHAIRLGLITA